MRRFLIRTTLAPRCTCTRPPYRGGGQGVQRADVAKCRVWCRRGKNLDPLWPNGSLGCSTREGKSQVQPGAGAGAKPVE